MAEGQPPKGKASRLDELLAQRPLSAEELERRYGPRPELRLTAEVLNQAVESSADVGKVVDQVDSQGVAVMRGADGPAAIAIPVDQYLDFVTSHIRDKQRYAAGLDGRIGPSNTTLAELGAEQVNPRDTWVPVQGYDPSAPPQ